jgi:hypothetical protein
MRAHRFDDGEIAKRIAGAQSIFVDYSETIRVREEIATRLHFGLGGVCARLTLFIGPTGCGKSAVIKDYLVERASADCGSSRNAPILYVSLPRPCTIKGMTSAILEALGDPLCYQTSTTWKNSSRITHQLREQQYSLLIIDEFQHLIDLDRGKVHLQATDWLKTLLDNAGVPVICVGMPNSVDVIRQNPQLTRRTTRVIQMQPFSWDNGPHSLEFRACLRFVESKLGFDKNSDLCGATLAYAFYRASNGLIGIVIQLILEAIPISMRRSFGDDCITAADLAEAYAGLPSAHPENPFDARWLVHEFNEHLPAINSKAKPRSKVKSLSEVL